MIRPTQRPTLTDACRKTWDALVIGAGPAGALAADLLGRHGLSVLLVDAKAFPREKACGGCLNARSLQLLAACGLEGVLPQASAARLSTLRLVDRHRELVCPLSNNVVINRARFDAALVEAAILSGAEFHPTVTAHVLPQADREARRVQLKQGEDLVEVAARIVLCADGLTQSSLRQLPEFSTQVSATSRIGLGAVVLDDNTGSAYPIGQLTMAVGAEGYVGLARSADGSLSMAAAVDAAQLRACGPPAALIQRIMNSAGLPVSKAVDASTWHGTPPLTRSSPRVAADRLLVLGDALGYVEPFTGEGIAWAMLSAVLAVPLAIETVNGGSHSLVADWNQTLKRKVYREQWMCQLLARLLRSPRLTRFSLEIFHKLPILQRGVMSRVGSQPLVALPTIPPPRGSC